MTKEPTTNGAGIQLRGPVSFIGPVETNNRSGYQKRMVTIRYEDPKYPRMVAVAFGGKLIDRVDKVQAGDEVLITCDINSREYEGRYYTELRGWMCEIKHKAAAKQEQAPEQHGDEQTGADGEKLPF